VHHVHILSLSLTHSHTLLPKLCSKQIHSRISKSVSQWSLLLNRTHAPRKNADMIASRHSRRWLPQASKRSRLMLPKRKPEIPTINTSKANHCLSFKGFAPITGQGTALKMAVSGTAAFKLKKLKRAEP